MARIKNLELAMVTLLFGATCLLLGFIAGYGARAAISHARHQNFRHR
jgi:hypothetical protein